ncbi:hypothetical protein EVAR_57092_1 [Eumeta japonica]|uniref:Uncharacterized protein n=1 Tax=Eumeta variegata TaxID=151549 RepID=A0A4C1Z8P5_EUMVA|nr:hypothetical protein EVAR_57092_1 [Eumeta japonica]
MRTNKFHTEMPPVKYHFGKFRITVSGHDDVYMIDVPNYVIAFFIDSTLDLTVMRIVTVYSKGKNFNEFQQYAKPLKVKVTGARLKSHELAITVDRRVGRVHNNGQPRRHGNCTRGGGRPATAPPEAARRPPPAALFKRAGDDAFCSKIFTVHAAEKQGISLMLSQRSVNEEVVITLIEIRAIMSDLSAWAAAGASRGAPRAPTPSSIASLSMPHTRLANQHEFLPRRTLRHIFGQGCNSVESETPSITGRPRLRAPRPRQRPPFGTSGYL